jgi:hypothetical protein
MIQLKGLVAGPILDPALVYEAGFPAFVQSELHIMSDANFFLYLYQINQ